MLLQTLSLLTLASATPLLLPRAGGPAVIDGQAVQLAVRGNLSSIDPANAADNAWILGMQRVGQGVYAAVVGPRSREKTQNQSFYFNATANSPTTLNADIPGVYPLVAEVGPRGQPGEHWVEFRVDNGQGTQGLSWGLGTDGIPTLGGLGRGSGWMVCRRDLMPGQPSTLVPRYVYEDEEPIEGCVGVDFVVLCGQLADLGAGSGWTHEFVRDVKCVAQ